MFKLEEAQRRISKPHIPSEKADWLLCVRHLWALHRHIACWCNESAFQLSLCHPPHVYLWGSMATLLSWTLTVKELNFPVQEETPCIAVKPLWGQSGLCLACSKITSSICASNFKGGEILRVLEVWLSLKDSGQLGPALFWQDSSADQQETATSFSDSLESSVWEKACVFCPVQLGMCMMSLPHPEPSLFPTHIPTQWWMYKCRRLRSWPYTLWGSSDEMPTPPKLTSSSLNLTKYSLFCPHVFSLRLLFQLHNHLL